MSLSLESPAFSDNGEIPKKYGYKQENKNPPLKISGVPENAKSLTLIMDDPDAKAAVGKVWVHWLMWNIDPSTDEIPEGKNQSGITSGKNDFGELGYGGPAPPDKEHTYIFKLCALDAKLDLSQGASKEELEKAIKDHVLAEATLKGRFSP